MESYIDPPPLPYFLRNQPEFQRNKQHPKITFIISFNQTTKIIRKRSHSSEMAKPRFVAVPPMLLVITLTILIMATQAKALMPYTRSPLFDMMLPFEDPFRILEQTPLTIPKEAETLALARADWKETPTAHEISLDIPGMKRDDVKIEVEENRVLRVSGERKSEKEVEGEKWHRAERTRGKFWRQFRMPMNADLDHVKAHLENGVLRITVPKVAEEKKKRTKVINIAEEGGSKGEGSKAEM